MWTETRSVYTRSVVSWNGLDRAFTGSVETLGGVGVSGQSVCRGFVD